MSLISVTILQIDTFEYYVYAIFEKKSSLSVGLITASLNPILFAVTVYRYFIIYYKLNYSMNVLISLGFIVIRHYFIHRTEEFYHRCHIA